MSTGFSVVNIRIAINSIALAGNCLFCRKDKVKTIRGINISEIAGDISDPARAEWK
jgi:hypothetical protein